MTAQNTSSETHLNLDAVAAGETDADNKPHIESKKEEPAPSGFADKIKWLGRKLNPISELARTDIKIIRNSMRVEHNMKHDSFDANIYPEIKKVATVRQGEELCPDEKQFLAARKLRVRTRFAEYIGVDPAEVHPDDIPVIGFGGSGGGFRAMLGVVGYSIAMRKAGLWDLVTYISGVSGSCWALGAYYTFANCDWDEVLTHFKRRLYPYHPLSSEAIRALMQAPGGTEMAIGPLVQKDLSGLHVTIMDFYSVFTSGHLWLHEKDQKPANVSDPEHVGVNPDWFRWSEAQKALVDGAEPLPILTAVRHERPWKAWYDKENPFKSSDIGDEEHTKVSDAYFQWFEMTPYEVGCDELKAWVPTWGFGRPFSRGKSIMQLPEHSLALLMGLCTSAPAGPLTSYIAAVQRSLPPGFLGNRLRDFSVAFKKVWGKKGTQVFVGHHPLHACNEHNFLFHLSETKEGQGRPPGIENSPRIHLIDSGMDNNCPTYVLLHPERECDVIINMDASSDVQADAFPQRIDHIGARRGMKFTRRPLDSVPEKQATGNVPENHGERKPNGHAPPPNPVESIIHPSNNQTTTADETTNPKPSPNSQTQQPTTPSQGANIPEANPVLASTILDPTSNNAAAPDATQPPTWPKPKSKKSKQPPDPYRFRGQYAQIFDGRPARRPTTVLDTYNHIVPTPPAPTVNHNCTMIYMPLLPNEDVVPGYDPSMAKWSGSYSMIWTPEQVDMVMRVCEGNFKEGEKTVKKALRHAWELRREKRMGGKGSGWEGSERVDWGSKYGRERDREREEGQMDM